MTQTNGILTVGYEDLTIEQFIHKLRDYRVNSVVDVRLTPVSRRLGFSKKRLDAALSSIGIQYVHERDLGNPPENRESFRSGEPSEGRAVMRARLEGNGGEALHRLVDRARGELVALLCVEREDFRCHRQVIVEMAREIAPDLPTASIW